MAWNEELTRTFAGRCSECRKAIVDGEIRQEIGIGHAMHVECYQKVLDDIERGVLGDSDEDAKPENEHLKRFLDGAEDAKRRASAYERNKELWGEEAAKRIDEVATWITNIKRKKQSKS